MALPALLVFAEPDFGTALVYAAVTLGMLFVLGAPWRHFAWLGLAFVVDDRDGVLDPAQRRRARC